VAIEYLECGLCGRETKILMLNLNSHMWLIVTILNSIDLEDWLDSGSVSLTRILHKWCSRFHIASQEANDANSTSPFSFNGYDCHL